MGCFGDAMACAAIVSQRQRLRCSTQPWAADSFLPVCWEWAHPLALLRQTLPPPRVGWTALPLPAWQGWSASCLAQPLLGCLHGEPAYGPNQAVSALTAAQEQLSPFWVSAESLAAGIFPVGSGSLQSVLTQRRDLAGQPYAFCRAADRRLSTAVAGEIVVQELAGHMLSSLSQRAL